MDVKFDATAANNLIKDMDRYCRNVSKETKSLRAIMKDNKGWDDAQSVAFTENVECIAQDLNGALSIESEYMKIYYQRVKELRG